MNTETERGPILLNTYQNENESHAIILHLLNQDAEVLEAGAESEVQLPVHVIDVYMLDILQEGASKMLGILWQYPAGPTNGSADPIAPYTDFSILLIEIAF